jgi:hypothetical protein
MGGRGKAEERLGKVSSQENCQRKRGNWQDGVKSGLRRFHLTFYHASQGVICTTLPYPSSTRSYTLLPGFSRRFYITTSDFAWHICHAIPRRSVSMLITQDSMT